MITLTLTAKDFDDLVQQLQAATIRFAIVAKEEREQKPAPVCEEPNRRKFRVLTSPYSDINPGNIATMMEEKDDGYALCFDQQFTRADKPDVRTKQTRIVFFKKKHVEEIK